MANSVLRQYNEVKVDLGDESSFWSKVVFLAPKLPYEISWQYVEWFMSYYEPKAMFLT